MSEVNDKALLNLFDVESENTHTTAEKLQQMTEKLNAFAGSPTMRKLNENMKKITKSTQVFFNSPEIKQSHESLKSLQNFMNSSVGNQAMTGFLTSRPTVENEVYAEQIGKPYPHCEEGEPNYKAYLAIPAVTIPEAISLITDRKIGGECNDNDQLYFILKRNMEWGVFGEQKKTQEGECLISLPAFIQWTKKQGIKLPKELSDLYLDEDSVLSLPQQILVSHRDIIQVENELYIKNIDSKPKQKRENTLHEKIRQVYKDSKDKSPRIIWKKLKQLADEEDDDIIQEVDSWTKPGAKIFGISGAGMKKRTFQNLISKLKNCKSN